MKRAIAISLVAVVLLISTEADAACYKFEWTGFVERIEDSSGNPAELLGVYVDDMFVATVTYDTTAFGPGVYITSDVLDYPAPPGLEMIYQFESGFSFFKDISAVRVGKTLDKHQWNWKGGDFGGLLFQANDWTHSAFNLPLPVLFDEMHTLFLGTHSMFEPSSGNHLGVNMGSDDERRVSFRDQTFFVTPCITENAVSIDIKPGSCPNPLNVKSKGVLPVAILGTEGFDVSEVDVGYVSLEGVAPIRFDYEDVATPFEGELCDCHEDGPDGIPDLILYFETQEVVDALGPVVDGVELELILTAGTVDGIPLEGSDCIRIIKKGKD